MTERISTAHKANNDASLVKNLPAMQETWIQSLCWEDPLEKGKATHSSILAAKSQTRLSNFHFTMLHKVTMNHCFLFTDEETEVQVA